MQLYEVKYQRGPHPAEVVYVIAESKLKAINISQPFYNENEPKDYNNIYIRVLCPESYIVKQS